MAHELLKVGFWRPYYHMEMIAHEYKGQELHLVDVERTLQKLKELPPVLIPEKDTLPSITPA